MSLSPPNTQGSIRQRLLIMLLVSAASTAILLYLVVQSVAEQIAQESQDNILAASAISILDSARVVEGDISIDLPYSSLSMLDSVTDERAFYAIRLNDEFLSGYPDLPGIEAQNDVTAFQSTTYLDEDIRIASTRRSFSTLEGQAYLEISVAQTLTGLNQSIARISRISLAVGCGFFLLSMIVAMVIAKSTIRPLHRLTDSVSRRGPSDLRPVAAPVPVEMAPLVSSLNSLMTRLQKSLSRSEDFIAEAAHRVRTPMAIVRTQAEVTLRRVEKEENRQAVREMIRAVDESSRTAGQLLDHAMVSFRTDDLALETIQLDDLIVDTVNRLHPISELRDVEIKTQTLARSKIQGDPILVQNAIQNVLDNAVKYTAADTMITVLLDHSKGFARIHVRDEGSGFDETEIDRLIQRFERGKNADGIVGSGLGLTIVDDIMRAHGGHIKLTNNSGEGACVTLSFPV
jgi:two-component system sensor histidine kinase TctE